MTAWGTPMGRYLLFHREPVRFDNRYAWVDKWCALGDMWPVCIDASATEEEVARTQPPLVCRTLEEALALPTFHGHTFVWLDPQAQVYLDEFAHPEDGVVYCVGSDVVGFGGLDHEGPRVRVREQRRKLGEEPWQKPVISNGSSGN